MGLPRLFSGPTFPPETPMSAPLRHLLVSHVGDVTKYVIEKAPCRVIVTAPAARDSPVERSRRAHRTDTSIV